MRIFLVGILFLCLFSCKSQSLNTDPEIVTGAAQLNLYLPKLEGKSVAVIVNQTSMIHNTHLVDTLLSRGINIVKVFAPEHGFRGKADAGENISSAVDTQTGLAIVSLYGENKKPTADQLADVDIVVFDIQDVGTRFYTYISTMYLAMEACAEQGKTFMVLDRPNPNGNYIDGPILEPAYKSFVGLLPIPVVHGLTVGELAQMINGENWLKDSIQCELEIVKVKHYTHKTPYILPVRPSPNLPNQQAILLYPSLCFFEGTPISVGRGTDFPFQAIGYPAPRFGDFTFTPTSSEGAKYPPLENQLCYGKDLRNASIKEGLNLSYLIDFYKKAENKKDFFSSYFKVLAGNETLQKQIADGLSEDEIKHSWEPTLAAYRDMRKKYLLYP